MSASNVGVAVLAVVVAAAAEEQAVQLVVRVRVVGAPAVAGERRTRQSVRSLEEDASKSTPICSVSRPKCLSPGLGQEGDARLMAGAGVEAELERPGARRVAVAELRQGRGHVRPWPTSRSYGYGSRSA